MKTKSFQRIAILLLCLLTGLALSAIFAALTSCAHLPSKRDRLPTVSESEIVRRVAASSVTVFVRSEDEGEIRGGIGSGTVVWANGQHSLVLTCDHVVFDREHEEIYSLIRVAALGGEPTLAVVEQRSPEKDLALLFVASPFDVPALPVARIDPEVYDRIFVVGSPDGIPGTAVAGMIAGKGAVNRGIPLWIVDAFTFPGVSGGTVANLAGELVCVPESVQVSSAPFGTPTVISQIGFCVPLPNIKSFLASYRIGS